MIESKFNRSPYSWLLIVLLVGTISAIVQYAIANEVTSTQEVAAATRVVDGDTIEINGETVRLYGIDAPELGQFCYNGSTPYRCGYQAALKLKKLVSNGTVECRPTPVDESDTGQICSVGLIDLAEAMLRVGYAVATPSTLAVYRRAENDSKNSKLGIWRGNFVLPSEWRAGQRLQTEIEGPKQLCDIKGIVSDKGDRVYLVSTDPEYDEIELDQSRGEQFFCSDDEAELAGWRRWPKAAVRQRTIAEYKQ